MESKAGPGQGRSRDGRIAGTAQGIGLILALALPTTPLLALVPNLPQLQQHFAAVAHSEFLVPMVITIPSICIALLSPIAGSLADRWGRRRLLMWALALFTVAGLMPLVLEDLHYVILSQLGVGIAEAFIMTLGNALLGDYFDAGGRQKWLGIQSILGSMIASATLPAGGFLGTFSWHAPFAVNLLGGVVFAWMALHSWEVEAPGPTESAATTAEGGFPWRAMRLVLLVALLTSVLYFTQAVELGVIFAHLGASSSLTISIVTLVASVGVILGGVFFRRHLPIGTGGYLSIIYFVYGLGLIGLSASSGYLAGLPFGVIAQFGNGLAVPVLVGWSLSKLDFKYRGRGMGIFMSCFFLGQFFAPILLTLLTRIFGGFLHGIAAIGVVCAVLALLTLWLARGNLRTAPAAA